MASDTCDHKGLLATKFVWLRGTFYAICRRCGADLRDRINPEITKLN